MMMLLQLMTALLCGDISWQMGSGRIVMAACCLLLCMWRLIVRL